MLEGLIALPWWGYIVVALVFTHITIASVTIYLHRHQAHRALDLHPLVSHFFRFWLWLTSGMVTKEWAAIHRKHHAKCETAEDPHSPQVLGIRKVLREGSELYRAEAKNQETLDKYGHGTPSDWIERNLYTPHSGKGIALMFIVNVLLFGPLGITIWAVQMMWIPITAAGIINGIGHFWGYRNYENADASTNIVPWGILIGGEELHNNHHTFASSAKLSSKWWEFDIGWLYIRTLEIFGLAHVKKIPPELTYDKAKDHIDLETVKGRDHGTLRGYGAVCPRSHDARAPRRDTQPWPERQVPAHAAQAGSPVDGARTTSAGRGVSHTPAEGLGAESDPANRVCHEAETCGCLATFRHHPGKPDSGVAGLVSRGRSDRHSCVA